MDGSDATLNTAKKAFDPVFTYSKDHGQHHDVSAVMAYGGHTHHRYTDVVSVTLAGDFPPVSPIALLSALALLAMMPACPVTLS